MLTEIYIKTNNPRSFKGLFGWETWDSLNLAPRRDEKLWQRSNYISVTNDEKDDHDDDDDDEYGGGGGGAAAAAAVDDDNDDNDDDGGDVGAGAVTTTATAGNDKAVA